MAEHHDSSGLMGSAPEVLIARIASVTERMRVGSGGVQLEDLAAATGADEFSAVTITPEFEQRVRSHELLAEAFGLPAPGADHPENQ